MTSTRAMIWSTMRGDEFWKVKKASDKREGRTKRDASKMPFLETPQQII